MPSVLKLGKGNENNSEIIFLILNESKGWSGGAKVLRKLSVPGRPSNFDNSRGRAYCACSRCGWGSFGHFSSPLSFLTRHGAI